MANPEPQRPDIRIAPEGRSRHEIFRRPRHPENCETRQDLFGSAVTAQRNTVEFLHDITGVNVQPLVDRFVIWQRNPLTPPSTTRLSTAIYFNTLALATVTPEDRRGSLATLDRDKAGQQVMETNRKRMELFEQALKNHLTGGLEGNEPTATSESGKSSILRLSSASVPRLPEGFLDTFVAEIIANPKEQMAFRAYLAGELFRDIHDALIFPGHRMARELDDKMNHQAQFVATNTEEQRAIQTGKTEMDTILRTLPFALPPQEPIHVESSRLKSIEPRFLQYFSALGWDERLKQMVTAPYAARMKEITMPLFADLN